MMVGQAKAPAVWDFSIWRGSNQPVLVFVVKGSDGNLESIVDNDFIYIAKAVGGATIRHSLSGGGLSHDPETGQISYTPSVDESRLYNEGRRNSYSVERRYPDGRQAPYLYGTITGHNYLNDD